ncbi:hypothetical protein [Intrasporangium sp.]|uniref:hypothetical protein n=1 Tax=Intrasporangium sp. TaxID=1925024 RepID=UPI003221831A
MTAQIGECDNEAAQALEMRLANKFDRVKFSVGQANDSDTSKNILSVAIPANGKQLDVRNIPFNRVQDFNVKVEGVNALEISLGQTRRDGDCTGSVRAVIFDGSLS